MRSNIDWNEIVPLLGEGLKQTLYLEAIRLMGERRPPSRSVEARREYGRAWYAKNREKLRRYRKAHKKRRDYKAEWQARKRASGITRRQFTPEQRGEMVAYFKEHGVRATMEKYKVLDNVVRRWASGKVKAVAKAS